MPLSPGELAERLLQFQFLLSLYALTGNSPNALVPSDDLRQRGADIRLFANAISNLVPEGLILQEEGAFRITQKGADTVRRALAQPLEPTEYFPPVAPLFVEKVVWLFLGENDESAESFNQVNAGS